MYTVRLKVKVKPKLACTQLVHIYRYNISLITDEKSKQLQNTVQLLFLNLSTHILIVTE